MVLTVTAALPAAGVVGTDTRNTTRPGTAAYSKALILAAAASADWAVIVTATSEAWGGAVVPGPKFFVATGAALVGGGAPSCTDPMVHAPVP